MSDREVFLQKAIDSLKHRLHGADEALRDGHLEIAEEYLHSLARKAALISGDIEEHRS